MLLRTIIAEIYNENRNNWKIKPTQNEGGSITDVTSTVGFKEIYEYQESKLQQSNTYLTTVELCLDEYQQRTKRDKQIGLYVCS